MLPTLLWILPAQSSNERQYLTAFILSAEKKYDTKLKILIKSAAAKKEEKNTRTEQKNIMSKTLVQLAEVLAAKRMLSTFRHIVCVHLQKAMNMHRNFNNILFLPANYIFPTLVEPVVFNGTEITAQILFVKQTGHKERKIGNKENQSAATLYSLYYNGQTNQHFIVLALRFYLYQALITNKQFNCTLCHAA